MKNGQPLVRQRPQKAGTDIRVFVAHGSGRTALLWLEAQIAVVFIVAVSFGLYLNALWWRYLAKGWPEGGFPEDRRE